ncbi:uncharacterized protein BO66DRAFT_389474 [Aspergillus aculeatinus CBS 121060]|uniref:Uncharacterized protein n=1 Tax=Aspergillus aculeatinus CBS 121060 TaxID=1448322 RepID=A0ACD1HH57_9EURO|nr:hypothetical protein BO66DRAFT_389474 [Aspergillus aculeatinus CBS 121060]RAH72900.1 hypothetical protein BO66DRAFT_389474 [Aspergillus aculeatinus CBS 121060]
MSRSPIGISLHHGQHLFSNTSIIHPRLLEKASGFGLTGRRTLPGHHPQYLLVSADLEIADGTMIGISDRINGRHEKHA